MTEAEEYMAFTKGDELAIIQILETCNCSEKTIIKIQDRLHLMQKHSCMYGQVMASIGKAPVKEKEQYLKLLSKYEKAIETNKALKIKCKELTESNKKLSKMVAFYDKTKGREKRA
ncbi:hypothetical protein ACWG0P_13945 [Amedibacillus sp. YH-ame6]